ncbi:hypothetical protein L9F63_004350, partial [Diploptera punctata]
MNTLQLIILFAQLLACSWGGLKVSVKKTRAPVDLEENLDDRNVQVPEPSNVPPGFLSPSVKEYLELGKSIPEQALIHFDLQCILSMCKLKCSGQKVVRCE